MVVAPPVTMVTDCVVFAAVATPVVEDGLPTIELEDSLERPVAEDKGTGLVCDSDTEACEAVSPVTTEVELLTADA